jgi:hypothetical protein
VSLFVKDREVEHQKKVVIILIYLGALDAAEAVIQVQGVEEWIQPGQLINLPSGGLFDVGPRQAIEIQGPQVLLLFCLDSVNHRHR